MTREEAIKHGKEQLEIFGGEHREFIRMAIKALEQEPKTEQFAKWVAVEIFDDMWEYNKDSFAEIACRKLAKLGIVRAKGDEWELVEPKYCDRNICTSNEYNGIGCDECEVTKSQGKIKEPIHRDRTVQDFVDKCRECGREKVLDKIRAEIEQITDTMGVLDKQITDGWVSCSERLPEDSGEYLVTVIDEDDETYRHTGIAWYAHPKHYDIKDGEWRELMINEIVIAWMPLSEPYKAETEGEE